MQRTIFVSLDDGLGNLKDLGFVKVSDECSYVEVRREIENDELIENNENFLFLGERNLPLTLKQEDKFKVISNEVTIRLSDMRAPKRQKTVIDLSEKQASVTDPSDPSETSASMTDPSETFVKQEFQHQASSVHDSIPSDTRLQSNLASKAELYKWQKAIKQATARMRERNRKDRFELVSRDVGGKAEFSIWCVECNMRYGKGGSDTMYNFVHSHCDSKTHVQNCAQNHMEETPTCEEEKEEDRRRENKSTVDHCLSTEVAAFMEERGVTFKLYEPSVCGYAKLDAICIVCVTCEKTLNLFPRTGCLGQNLSYHITSNRHVHASMEAERRTQTNYEGPSKGGRPKKIKLAERDPRQGSLLSFVREITRPGQDRRISRKHKEEVCGFKKPYPVVQLPTTNIRCDCKRCMGKPICRASAIKDHLIRYGTYEAPTNSSDSVPLRAEDTTCCNCRRCKGKPIWVASVVKDHFIRYGAYKATTMSDASIGYKVDDKVVPPQNIIDIIETTVPFIEDQHLSHLSKEKNKKQVDGSYLSSISIPKDMDKQQANRGDEDLEKDTIDGEDNRTPSSAKVFTSGKKRAHTTTGVLLLLDKDLEKDTIDGEDNHTPSAAEVFINGNKRARTAAGNNGLLEASNRTEDAKRELLAKQEFLATEALCSLLLDKDCTSNGVDNHKPSAELFTNGKECPTTPGGNDGLLQALNRIEEAHKLTIAVHRETQKQWDRAIAVQTSAANALQTLATNIMYLAQKITPASNSDGRTEGSQDREGTL